MGGVREVRERECVNECVEMVGMMCRDERHMTDGRRDGQERKQRGRACESE